MLSLPNCFYRVSVKALILDDHKKFLLIKENNSLWEFPGGGLDHGEQPHDCLRREIKEEMGLEVTHINPEPCYFVTAYHDSVQWRAYIFYETRVNSLDFTPSDECVELKFFSSKETVTEQLHPIVKEFIKVFNTSNHKP